MRPPFGRTVPGNRWDLALDNRALDDPASELSISVVVAHFEQPVQLARTLAALRAQTRPADQVVVADDGSSQPPEPADGVLVVSQDDRGFRAAAVRNLGARHATGDLLVFLDADTTPEPDFLERLTRLPARLPELLAVGRRRYVDPATGAELAEPAWLSRGYAETDDLLHADATGHRFVISSVLACSLWWFEELGGFDERFVGYGGEDWELAARSWRRGGLVAHVPAAVAWHDGPAAGEDGRPTGSPDDAVLAQTCAVADRVGAPGATYRGLLLGPPDLIVTVDPALGRRALTVTLDSLLAALPRARVALDAPAREWFADDPRIVAPAAGDWLATDYRGQLRLTSAVHGSREAWAEVAAGADGTDPAATTELHDSDGTPIGELLDLRQHRRAERWNDAGLLETGTATTSLEPADRTSLQAWLEGWA